MKRFFSILFFLLISFALHAQIWSKLNGPYGAYTNAIAAAPDGTIYLSTISGNIYKSTDKGASWTNVYEGAGEFYYDIEIDAAGKIYAAGGALLVSDDGGVNWISRPLPPGSYSNLIKKDPNNTDVLYVYDYTGNGRLFKSINDGVQWDEVLTGGDGSPLNITGIAITNTGAVLISRYGTGIWKSDTGDAGSFVESNTDLSSFNILDLILDKEGNVLITDHANFFYSDNDGGSWVVKAPPASSIGYGKFFADPDGDVLYANNDDELLAFNSQDQTWTETVLNYPPHFFIDLICSPVNGELVLASHGGPVSYSTDNGATWVDASAGLSNPDLTDVLVASSGRVVVAGSTGIYSSSDNGQTFTKISENSVNDLYEAPDGTLFATGSPLSRSIDGGESFINIAGAPYLYSIDAYTSDILFGVNGNQVFYSEDNGDIWTELVITDGMPDNFGSVVGYGTVNYSNWLRVIGDDLYWLVRNQDTQLNELYKIPYPSGQATRIEIAEVFIGLGIEKHGDFLYMLGSNNGQNNVYYSENPEVTWDFKPVPNSTSFRITSEGIWFAGTINSLYYSRDNGDNWIDISYTGNQASFNMLNADISPSGQVFFQSRFDLPLTTSLAPSNLTFSAITPTSFSGSFTPAPLAPDGYVVLMSANVPPDIDPVDGEDYADEVSGRTPLGTVSGNEVYAVYSGTGTFFNVEVSANEALYFKVFPYTGSGTNINYYTADPLTNYIITPPASPASPDLFHVFSKGLTWMFVTDNYIDGDGNYYITGAYFAGNGDGTNDFDPDPNEEESLQTYGGPSPPLTDCFIAKYDPNGNLLWAKGIGGDGDDTSRDIKVSGSSVYVCGNFNGTNIDLDPDPAADQLITRVDNHDGFVVKLGAETGAFEEGWGVIGPGFDIVNSIAVDGSDFFITGQRDGNLFFEKYTLGAAAPGFTQVLSGGGTGKEIVADGLRFIVGGEIWGSGYFDPGVGAFQFGTQGGADIVFATYNSGDGTFAGIRGVLGGVGEDRLEDLLYNDNQLYITGSFEQNWIIGGLSPQGEGKDIFIANYNMINEALDWKISIGGPGDDTGRAIAMNSAGDIFVTGDFAQIVDFDPGTNYANKAAAGRDCFLLKVDGTTGDYLNAISFGDADDFSGDSGVGLVINSDNDILLAPNFGTFNKVDVDPTGAVYHFPSNSGFVKYSEIPSPVDAPMAQPGSLTFLTTATSFTGRFTAPLSEEVDGYLVLMRESQPPFLGPVNSVVYPAGTFHDNAVAIYSGPDTTFTVNNANPTVTYYFAIYAFNGSSGSISYNTVDPPLTGYYTLEPTEQSSNIIIQERKTDEVTFTFTPGNGQFQLVVFKENSDVDAVPDDFSTGYDGGLTNSFGDGSKFGTDNEVVAIGAGSTDLTVPGLNPGTFYSIAIFDFNDPQAVAGGSTSDKANYFTDNAEYNPTNFYTLALEPAQHPGEFRAEPGVETITLTFQSLNSLDDADGYVILRRAGSTDPSVTGIVDGTINFSDPSLPDSLTTIFGRDQTTYTDSGLTPGTTYRYIIIPYNIGSDALETRNYKIDSPRSAFHVPLDDETSPDINDNTPNFVQAGSAINITATITDNESQITAATVEFRSITAGEDSNTQQLTPNGSTYTSQILASQIGELGIEYKLSATSTGGTRTDEFWKQVRVQSIGSGLTIPYNNFGDKVTNYRIVAVPLVLNSPGVISVFDELGAADAKKWRVARYQNGNTTQSYNGTIEPGKGYWLIVRESPGEVINSGQGTTVEATADAPFILPVVSGWNQIGNPYNFDIDWSDLRDANPSLPSNFRHYRNGSFEDGDDEIRKMEGVFINVGNAGTLVFPVVKPTGGRKSKNAKKTNPLDDPDWEVYLNVEQGDLKNLISGVGMHPEASLENDIYDGLSMPRFNDYLELNHTKSLHGFAYSKDIVPTANSFVWDFTVETSITDEQLITIFWDNSYFGDNEKQLVLWDVSQQKTVDMRLHNHYQFHKKTSGQFRVIFGDEDFVREKTRVSTLVFHNIAPNPVQDEAIISFSLPQTERVVIELTDITGRKTETVFEAVLNEGYHEVTYKNNNNTRTGVYIAQIKTGSARAQKRMILKN